jgi:flagellar hook-associated protein 2
MAGIHVGGLASGMDTQATIDALLEIRRAPITLLKERQAEIGYDMAAWADVSTYMTELTEALDTLRSWDTWNQMTATSSVPTAVAASATSAAAEGAYALVVSQLARAHSVASDRVSDLSSGAGVSTDLVAAGVLTAGDTFEVGGQTITIGATESLNSLSGKINTAADHMAAGDKVSASIVDYHLVVTRVQTGSQTVSMADTGGTPLVSLGILTATGDYKSELTPGQDAEFTVNGLAVTRSSNTGLTDVISDVTLNLLGVTEEDETVTLEMTRDRESAKAAILAFVDKYNAAAAKLTEVGAITLSDGKGEASVERLGELHDDSLVRELSANLRREATAPKYPHLNLTNASYVYNGRTDYCDALSDIGIGTSGEENQLSVNDETRLDYMLAHHFDEVEQMFRGVFVEGQGYTHGVASDFYKYADGVSASLLGSIAHRTASLTDSSTALDENVAKLESRLETYEQSLWQQFSAMENAVQKMQSDLEWLQSQVTS